MTFKEGVRMRSKSIKIILLCFTMTFAPLMGVIDVGAKIDTSSQLEVINIGIEGTLPVIDGEIIVFSSYSWSSPPAWVYYHDTTTRTTYNTGVQGQHIGVENPYIIIYSHEFWLGDINGDGDENDYIDSFYDINNGTNTVFAENARICWPCLSNGKIVYTLQEPYDGVDYNGDGDLYDNCGFYYDIASGKSSYFADAFWPTIYGKYIIWGGFKTLWYYDLTTGNSFNIGFNMSYPAAQISLWEWKIEGDIIAFEVYEGGPNGQDLNGNGYLYDKFSAYYDITFGTLKIITSIKNYFVDISNGKILMDTSGSSCLFSVYDIQTDTIIPLQNYFGYFSDLEADIIVGNDWSGAKIPEAPPPVGVPNVLIYNINTDEFVNTHIIGFLTDWKSGFNGNIIAIVTSEANIPEDLNSDGDINDWIVRYIIEKTPLPANIDINPDNLNLRSKGRWITCYIEFPEGFDVNEVDVSTILLEDMIQAQSRPITVEDYDSDSIPELMVKFDRSEVEELLSPGTYNLKITGELKDGSLFEGYSDTIRVIAPLRRSK